SQQGRGLRPGEGATCQARTRPPAGDLEAHRLLVRDGYPTRPRTARGIVEVGQSAVVRALPHPAPTHSRGPGACRCACRSPSMKVFVTGHTGYIGVHLVDLLKQHGHTVTGCDLGLFDGCGWEPVVDADRHLHKDVRDLTVQELAGHDCVMHLAALS